MLSAYRRHGIVITLALLTGLVLATARPTWRDPGTVMPLVFHSTAAAGWNVIRQYTVNTKPYNEWQLVDKASGVAADLYLQPMGNTKDMLRWSGELSYEGVGFDVVSRRRETVRLGDGTAAPVSVLTVRHLNERDVLAYAIVMPGSIMARSTDNLLGAAWDIVHGGGPYYLVRASAAATPDDGVGRRATLRLLTPALSALRTAAH